MSCETKEVEGEVVKRTDDAAGAAYLRGEAAFLAAAAHPGVVEVLRSGPVEPDGWELVLRKVSGGHLSGTPTWSGAEVAGFGAAVATTIADLHDLGMVHGRVALDHVLVDQKGRPLLCGFGQARRWSVKDDDPDPRAVDVNSLADCLVELLPPDAPRDLRRVLARAQPGGRRRPLTARQLARALSRVLPNPRLPSGEIRRDGSDHLDDVCGGVVDQVSEERSETTPTVGPIAPPEPIPPTSSPAWLERSSRFLRARRWVRPAESGVHPRRPGFKILIGFVFAVAIVGAAGFGLFIVSSRTSPTAAGRRVAAIDGSRCPVVDDGCGPVARPAGVLVVRGVRYRLGRLSDVTVLGRWTCAAEAYPALLRPGTGQVWIFDRWAASEGAVTGRLATRVAGGLTLQVVPEVGGCDGLEVLRRVGPPVMLRSVNP